jgi:hypothetical protein
MAQRLVAYYRVSTAKQGASGLGLEGQEAAVASYANSNKQPRPEDVVLGGPPRGGHFGPVPGKLPPSAIWPRLLGLSRKQCLETRGEQGETPDTAGLGTENFPENG